MKRVITAALIFVAAFASAQPTIWGGAKVKLSQGDTTFSASLGSVKTWLGLSGGGTVSSFAAGNLSPLFTTSVSNSTTTPNLSFALSNAAANTYFGNATGSSAAPSFTAAGALTKTDDTNVTMTLGGSPTTALLTGASITLGWTGLLSASRGGTNNGFTQFTGPTTSAKTFTLPNASATILTDNAAVTAAQGGTGNTSYTIGDLIQASGSTTLSKLNAVATGNVLLSGGVATVSSWGKVGLATHVSGTLPVANGGTNLTAVGSDVTLLGSNGSANIYYTLARTTNAAAIGWSRSSSTLNFNLPPADGSNEGLVSTTTQTFAGAKTFSGAATIQGLATASAGLAATATSSVAAVNMKGVLDADYRSVTTTSTISETDHTVYIGTLAADITINLPACNSTRDGWIYRFMKTGTDAFAFILDPNSTETFYDGASTKSFYSQGTEAVCQCQSGTTSWTVSR